MRFLDRLFIACLFALVLPLSCPEKPLTTGWIRGSARVGHFDHWSGGDRRREWCVSGGFSGGLVVGGRWHRWRCMVTVALGGEAFWPNSLAKGTCDLRLDEVPQLAASYPIADDAEVKSAKKGRDAAVPRWLASCTAPVLCRLGGAQGPKSTAGSGLGLRGRVF